jgi:hypothetical protein
VTRESAYERTTSSVSSVLPSETTSSRQSGMVWASTLSMVRLIAADRFQAGQTMSMVAANGTSGASRRWICQCTGCPAVTETEALRAKARALTRYGAGPGMAAPTPAVQGASAGHH